MIDSSLKILNEDELKDIQRDFSDIPKARFLDDNCNRISYKKSFVEFQPLMRELSKIAGEFVRPTGFYYYPIGGYCGWHTNSDNPGKRFYLTWSQEGDSSFFRYVDADSGECITKFDKKGWFMNQFEARSDKLLWHCVGSNTRRISIGFKTDPNHWLSDYYLDFKFRTEYHKGTSSFDNMINSCHSLRTAANADDKLDWSINGAEGRVPLRLFDHILFEETCTVPLSLISWKCKDNIQLKDFDCVDINLPCILVKTYRNPHDLPFRAIDGSHKLCKLKKNGAEQARALIINEETFMEQLYRLKILS
tara:strand:- start:1157 stop:2074 length:918 start_codon:yes stop_codon:yes gene_type:complete